MCLTPVCLCLSQNKIELNWIIIIKEDYNDDDDDGNTVQYSG